MNTPKSFATRLVCFLLSVVPGYVVYAHGIGPWGRALDWRTDQVDQVITAEDFGQKISVQGRDCVSGTFLNFKINDEYAFDTDETVWLDLKFYLGSDDAHLSVNYNTNDVVGSAVKPLSLPKGVNSRWFAQSIPLERARFANLGFEGTDFSIVATDLDFVKPSPPFTICSVSLRRSYTTSVSKVFGWAAIEVADEKGQPTPVRMGIYEPSGRFALPSEEALVLKKTALGTTRVVALGGPNQGLPPWPLKNRSAFYSDGRYHVRLPAGEYELVIAKGLEYRLWRQRFAVHANETRSIKVRLRRWTDMAAKGWYSGDDHVHYPRSSEHDDHTLQLLTQAEDLRVANILQYDNSAITHYPHYDWKPVLSDPKASFVLIPGLEGPRTSRLGHTMQLNIREPIRDPEHYLLYHKVFEQTHAQGGLTGYAHVNTELDAIHNATRGMAIDVPFGLVDLAEIMSLCCTGTSTWFDFLNLGYKLSPSAGTDYPLLGVPGAMRNYVQIDRQFTPQAWFDELKKGHTFVTSGPMLEISVNGHGMGSELHVKGGEPLVVMAKASMNPDVDGLSLLELIEQGDVVKAVPFRSTAPAMELRHAFPAKHGTWFVLRARGKNADVVALSGPIYVLVDDQGFWKRMEIPLIVARMKSKMQEVLGLGRLDATDRYEAQETFAKYWDAQQGALKERIDQASAIYDALARRAAAPEER